MVGVLWGDCGVCDVVVLGVKNRMFLCVVGVCIYW